ncbi:tyrosine-type recombinase/integrase [Pelagicoccus enzymogenes]|uniref:tyrosine-type recombinase/integrase n=1 Tax=Pelagicoccus enzymogenes TaxID=2773457 RepID=UPI00280FF93A|nr:tyrosine-type recombinase/integrase [Pelagicoccus enzymogenes]MDQ8198171.1 tyrosine-type recombinase/integrase [Pelagicoccus enzymogenes]
MSASSTNPMKRREYPKRSGVFIKPIIDWQVVGGERKAYAAYQVTIPKKLAGSRRIRKQFSTVKEAEKFAAAQHRGKVDEGKAYFRATDGERSEFAAVLPKLREVGLSLTAAVEYALVHMNPKGGVMTVEATVEELRRRKHNRFKKGTLSWDTYRDFKSKAEGFAAAFPDTLLRDVVAGDVVSWLEEMEARPRTIKNHFSMVNSVLKYAVAREYLVKSPTDSLTIEEKKELYGDDDALTEPSILTVDEAEQLLHGALGRPDLALLPAVVLALFCGIRTTELRRLHWSHVKDHESRPIVTIPSGIAKKRRIRNVDIPENAQAWLSLCRERRGRITYSPVNDDYYKRFRRLLEHLGYRVQQPDGSWKSHWKSNSMRHSFGSYHFAKSDDSIETSRLLGHKSSDDVLFEHYRALATRESGEAFFSISPPPGRGY